MGRGYLLGLDAGGSGGRALLFDPDDGTLLSANRSWTHPEAPGTGGFGYDLDLDGVWTQLMAATREVLDRAGAGARVLGVAASSMRFSLVVLDARGRPLLALPNRDGRAAAEALEIRGKLGDDLHQRTGLWPTPIMTLPRLLWFARHHEEAWQQARHVLCLGDWIAYRLCGELATDATQAGETLLFDLHTRDWSWDCLAYPELPRDLLPRTLAAGTRLGTVTPEAAEALGLRAGIPVAVGGADTQCGLLASGVSEPGQAGVVAGSTAPLQLLTEEPRVTEVTWSGHHLIEGRWVVESNGGIMGETLLWFASLLFPDAPDPVARTLSEAASSEPGAGGVLSSLGAEVMKAAEMRLPVGHLSLSPWTLPEPGEARAGLARAVLEGMAFAVQANLAQVRPGALRAGELHLAGGMSRSPFWGQLLADVTGQTVIACASEQSTALGAALCAGTAVGAYPSLSEAARALSARTRRYPPDASRRALYDEHRSAWTRLSAANAEADGLTRSRALPQLLRRASGESQSSAPSVRPRILATSDLDERALEALRGLGEVEHASFRDRMRLLTGRTLVDALQGFQVFVTEVDVVDADSLAKLPELRVIASCRGDAVNVDLAVCSAYGIPVLHAPGRNADAVADLTLAFLLMLARRLPEATRFLREPGGREGDMGRMGKAFGQLRGRELWRKTVGLVGFGAVGRGVARRLAGFDARVIVHDPFVPDDAVVRAGAEPVALEALLEESDFVSLHCAVAEDTRELIGAAELARMKPGACLVNTARAALVDEAALVSALREGELAGAAVDVFPVEPPGADHPLLALDHVIATPHVGGNTVDVGAHQGEIVADELARLLRGERPRHVLNPEVLEGFDWATPRTEPDPTLLAELAKRPGPAVSDTQRKQAPRARSSEPVRAAASAAPEVRERMQRILGGFAERIAGDEALAAFAADQDVTLHFVLSDLDLEIFFRLRGEVSAGLRAPDDEADVQLRMRADVLDGMFTGRVNAMQSAMEGKLSFTGDTVKAMALQQLQRDLARLYRSARDEVGDPGDLTQIPDPGEAPAPRTPLAPHDVREELVAAVRELYAQELITATGGNVSARVPGADELWITPSQLFKGDLRPEILARIGIDGRPLSEGPAPSSERLMHCALYRRPEVRAVVHAHAAHATILANAELPFLPVSTEAAFFSDIPRVPFIMPGTSELAEAVAEAMGSGWAVLMQNHGLIVAGRSLRRAADMVEIIDRTAQVILGCYAVGREPPTLPDDIVKKLRAMGDLIA